MNNITKNYFLRRVDLLAIFDAENTRLQIDMLVSQVIK